MGSPDSFQRTSYDAILDKDRVRLDPGGMTSDRITRLNTKTREMVSIQLLAIQTSEKSMSITREPGYLLGQ